MSRLILRSSLVGGGAPASYFYGRNADYDPGPVTHYCDPTKSTNGAGTLGDPYQPSQAMALSVSVMKLHVLWLPGSVTLASTADRHLPALRPTNSGTSAFRIVHRATNPAAYNISNLTQVRHSGGTGTGDGCPAFGFSGTDYVIFDGFYVDGSVAHYRGDTGYVVFHDCENCEVHRSKILGETVSVTVSPPTEDNHCGFRLDGTLNAGIKNCAVSGVRTFRTDTGVFSPSHNISCCMTYGCQGFWFIHNEFTGSNSSLYIKGSEPAGSVYNYGEIAFNKFDEGIENVILQDIDAVNRVNFHHNLITDYHTGLRLVTAGGSHGSNCDIDHNTWADQNSSSGTASDSYVIEWTGPFDESTCTFTNNIVTMRDIVSGARLMTIATPVSDIDRNLWYNGASDVRLEVNGAVATTIGDYRTAVSDEANGAFGNPLFTSSSVFTTQAGSPAKTMGAGSTEIGAYGLGTDGVGLQ